MDRAANRPRQNEGAYFDSGTTESESDDERFVAPGRPVLAPHRVHLSKGRSGDMRIDEKVSRKTDEYFAKIERLIFVKLNQDYAVDDSDVESEAEIEPRFNARAYEMSIDFYTGEITIKERNGRAGDLGITLDTASMEGVRSAEGLNHEIIETMESMAHFLSQKGFHSHSKPSVRDRDYNDDYYFHVGSPTGVDGLSNALKGFHNAGRAVMESVDVQRDLDIFFPYPSAVKREASDNYHHMIRTLQEAQSELRHMRTNYQRMGASADELSAIRREIDALHALETDKILFLATIFIEGAKAGNLQDTAEAVYAQIMNYFTQHDHIGAIASDDLEKWHHEVAALTAAAAVFSIPDSFDNPYRSYRSEYRKFLQSKNIDTNKHLGPRGALVRMLYHTPRDKAVELRTVINFSGMPVDAKDVFKQYYSNKIVNLPYQQQQTGQGGGGQAPAQGQRGSQNGIDGYESSDSQIGSGLESEEEAGIRAAYVAARNGSFGGGGSVSDSTIDEDKRVAPAEESQPQAGRDAMLEMELRDRLEVDAAAQRRHLERAGGNHTAFLEALMEPIATVTSEQRAENADAESSDDASDSSASLNFSGVDSDGLDTAVRVRPHHSIGDRQHKVRSNGRIPNVFSDESN